MSYSRKPESLATLLWKPRILQHVLPSQILCHRDDINEYGPVCALACAEIGSPLMWNSYYNDHMSESLWHLDYAPQHVSASCLFGKISVKNEYQCCRTKLLTLGVTRKVQGL